MLKRLLLGAALIGASPAIAADTAIIMWNGASVVTGTGVGGVDLGPENLGGVGVTLTTVNRVTHPNGLNEANIAIVNADPTAQTLHIIVGANDYLGKSDEFKLSGTIISVSGKADLAGGYFVDPADTLNGQVESVTGVGVNSFDSLALVGPDSFSFNGFGAESVIGPYGLAEELTLTLQPGAAVGVQGLAMTAVPEIPAWAMILTGFGLLGLVGRAKRPRLA